MTGEDTPNNWEEAGRTLLAERLEDASMDVLQEAFLRATRRVKSGEELTKADIEELRQALYHASHVVNLAAMASPEADPAPDLWDLLDEEDREKYMEVYKSEVGASRSEEVESGP